MTDQMEEILERFPRMRALVIGDAILDHYVQGTVSRTSPEAPVPVLHVEREEWLPGGAANVVRNLAAMDARVSFVALCGDDEAGTRMCEMLEREQGVQMAVVRDQSRPTTVKTRCMAMGQQMIRLDREVPGAPPPAIERRLVAAVRRCAKRVDGIILSDYAKGVLTPAVIEAVREVAREHGLETFVDPKGRDYRRYHGLTVITPNRKEAEEASGIEIQDERGVVDAARALHKQVRGKVVCVTLSAGGIAVVPRAGRMTLVPSRPREVFDPAGCGDSALAAMALARFAGADYVAAARVGNAAGGLVVERLGVATVTREELRRELSQDGRAGKLHSTRELTEVRRSMSRAGRRLVFTNGCFDLLNVRHIRLLEQARALGDALIVALNSDEGVRRLKGDPRPLLNLRERVDLISSLPYVDYVTVFDGDTPCELLEAIRPHVLVKGLDTTEVVGRELVEGYGGEVRQIDLGMEASAAEAIRSATRGGRR